jgi:hypothetical protein
LISHSIRTEGTAASLSAWAARPFHGESIRNICARSSSSDGMTACWACGFRSRTWRRYVPRPSFTGSRAMPRRDVIRTAPERAGHKPAPQPAVLLTPPPPSFARFHDCDGRRFQVFVFASPGSGVNVAMTPKTERPQVGIGLSSQPVIPGVMKVDLLPRPAGSAPSVMDRVVAPLALRPLRGLQVPAIFRRVTRH